MKFNLTLLLGLSIFLISEISYGQEKPTISNIHFSVKENGYINFSYDVTDLLPSDSIFVYLRNMAGTIIKPKSVIGDIGNNIISGKGKLISWNIVNDNFFVDDDYQAIIEVKLGIRNKIIKPKLLGGASNALLSMVAPGIGNIFVQSNKKVGLRPLVTLSYYGLLVYGFSLKKRADNQYGIYTSQSDEQIALPYYNAANANHQAYLMLSSAAALIWAVDVISTFRKGLKNDNLRKKSHTTFKIGTILNTPTVGFNHNF
jgi:hypothetical protein